MRVFENREFEEIDAEARLLVAQAASHEHDLVALVELLESRTARGSIVPAVGELAPPGDAATAGLLALSGVDLLARIRQLCVEAREHRLRADRHVRMLTGETATEPGLASARPRVLIVDDAEDIREVLSIALAAAGIETLTAADGLEALIAAHVARPALVLMDVNMPILNGIEATRLLRAGPATRDMPVIAHTARPDLLGEPIARLFELVLAKPAVPGDIVAAVRAFLADDRPPDPFDQL